MTKNEFINSVVERAEHLYDSARKDKEVIRSFVICTLSDKNGLQAEGDLSVSDTFDFAEYLRGCWSEMKDMKPKKQ